MSIFKKMGHNVHDKWKDLKHSFSSGNPLDPIPRVGAFLSPSNMFSSAKIGWGPMDLGTIVPDKVNMNFAKDVAPKLGLGTEGSNGFERFLGNKFGTSVGSIITAGMFGGGLMNGAQAPYDPELSPVELGPNTVKVGGNGGFLSNVNPKQLFGVGQALNSGGNMEQQNAQSQQSGYMSQATADLSRLMAEQKARQQAQLMAALQQLNS